MGSLLLHNLRLYYRRWDRYWDSQEGRRVLWYGIGWGIGGVTAAKMCGTTLFSTVVVDYMYQVYASGTRTPAPVPEALEALAEGEYHASDLPIPSQAHAELLVRNPDRPAASFFMARTSTPVGIGYPYSYHGAFIGLPFAFAVHGRQEAEKLALKLATGNNSFGGISRVDPAHPAFRDLVDSLVMSSKAKRFAIMQQIQLSKRYINAFFDSSAFAFLFGSAAGLSYAMNFVFELHRRRLRAVRFGVYGLFFTAATRSFMAIRDAGNARAVLLADKDACLYGRDYIVGGIEYVEKLLQRNRALFAMGGAASGLAEDGDYLDVRRFFSACPTSLRDRLLLLQQELGVYQLDPQIYGTSKEDFWQTRTAEAESKAEWAKDHIYEDSLVGQFKQWWENPSAS